MTARGTRASTGTGADAGASIDPRVLRLVAVGSRTGAYGGPFDTATRQARILARRSVPVTLAYGAFPGDEPDAPDADLLTLRTLRTVVRRWVGRAGFTTVVSWRSVVDVVRWVRTHDVAVISAAREPLPVIALVTALALRRPLVLQTHGNVTYRRTLKHRAADLVFRPAARRAGAIIALTTQERDALRAWLGRRRPPIHVIGNPSELDVRDTQAARDTERGRTVVFAGRMAARKRPAVFGQAAALAAQRGWPERYVALGPDHGELAALQDATATVPYPVYDGAVSAARLDDVMRSAGVFVLLSEREPWGNVLAQAINYGIPVVVSSSAALAPVVVECGLGLTVDGENPAVVAEAVHRLLAEYPPHTRVPPERARRLKPLDHEWYGDALDAVIGAVVGEVGDGTEAGQGPAGPVMSAAARLYRVVHQRPGVRRVVFTGQNVLAALRPPQVPVLGPGTGRTWHLAAVVRVKNEGPFIAEWLAHLVALGFEHVFVYDNASTDHTVDAVAPFVDRGLATVIDWPGRPIFPAAYRHFLATYGGAVTWCAFLDADEFLVEQCPGALAHALEAQADAPALAVNWRFYGSSHHETIPAELVTVAFPHAQRGKNHHVKVIARPSQIRRLRNSHNFYYHRGRLARTASGAPVVASFNEAVDADDGLVINHYVYRSREDYLRKLGVGLVDRPTPGGNRTRERAESEFELFNEVHAPVPDAVVTGIRHVLDDVRAPREG